MKPKSRTTKTPKLGGRTFRFPNQTRIEKRVLRGIRNGQTLTKIERSIDLQGKRIHTIVFGIKRKMTSLVDVEALERMIDRNKIFALRQIRLAKPSSIKNFTAKKAVEFIKEVEATIMKDAFLERVLGMPSKRRGRQPDPRDVLHAIALIENPKKKATAIKKISRSARLSAQEKAVVLAKALGLSQKSLAERFGVNSAIIHFIADSARQKIMKAGFDAEKIRKIV